MYWKKDELSMKKFLAFLLALVLGLWYPLHKKQVDENILRLKEKHAQTN